MQQPARVGRQQRGGRDFVRALMPAAAAERHTLLYTLQDKRKQLTVERGPTNVVSATSQHCKVLGAEYL